MLMRNSEHRKELISEIRSLAQSQGLNTVFTTFLEITANSLAAQTDPENAEKREQRYQEMASTMTPELLSSYARMLALLFLTVREYRDDPCDILGGIYHELNLNNEWNGQYPHTCPCCGSRLTFHTLPGGSKQLFCENPSCAAKLVQKFDHFCEKTRMNIEGLSATTLEKFIGHGWIKNFGDLYALEQHREDIIQTEGFGVKSYERLQESIEKSRHCTLAKFIAGLGIPMVGRHAGRDLDRYFGGSWEAFESAIQSGFDFTQLPNFGETMHNNIYKWYADEEEAKLWRPLLDKIIFEKETTNMSTNTSNPFYGKTVVATGKLENYTRDGIQMRLLELGAKPGSSVSKNTDYLIVGEKAGSKLAKAQQLGVKTLTEQEFENMLAE